MPHSSWSSGAPQGKGITTLACLYHVICSRDSIQDLAWGYEGAQLQMWSHLEVLPYPRHRQSPRRSPGTERPLCSLLHTCVCTIPRACVEDRPNSSVKREPWPATAVHTTACLHITLSPALIVVRPALHLPLENRRRACQGLQRPLCLDENKVATDQEMRTR